MADDSKNKDDETVEGEHKETEAHGHHGKHGGDGKHHHHEKHQHHEKHHADKCIHEEHHHEHHHHEEYRQEEHSCGKATTLILGVAIGATFSALVIALMLPGIRRQVEDTVLATRRSLEEDLSEIFKR